MCEIPVHNAAFANNIDMEYSLGPQCITGSKPKVLLAISARSMWFLPSPPAKGLIPRDC